MDRVRWLVENHELDALQQPVMVIAFTGWNDAADAASTAVRTLIESTGARAVAEFDPEPFTDFATTRPHVRLDEERRRTIVWPTVGVWSVSLPGADALLVLGPEPALQWRLFCDDMVEIAQRVDSPLAIALGALLADVPHSRPTPIIGTASDLDLVDRFELEPSRYEGPTGIVGVLQWAFGEAGIPAASLWAAVPGYAAQIPSPRASLALLQRTCGLLGTPIPRSPLPDAALSYDQQVDELISSDDDLLMYITRLEAMVDEAGGVEGDITGPTPLEDVVDDPDVLVSEVEDFLREHEGDS